MNFINYIIFTCLVLVSTVQAVSSPFTPNKTNIIALTELACSVDADKSMAASHIDNGVFFHEFSIVENAYGQFIISGECRIPVGENLHRQAGDELSFTLDPTNISPEHVTEFGGDTGDWMFRFYYNTNYGAQFDGKNLKKTATLSHFSSSTNLFVNTVFYQIPAVKAAIELQAKTTYHQYTFQKDTIWADGTRDTNVYINAIMDRTSGSILDRITLTTLNTNLSEIIITDRNGKPYGNGIFFVDSDLKIRGCTNFTPSNINIPFLDERTCRGWWKKIQP